MAKRQYDNTNRGMLFRVRDKKSDRHPDLNGKINIAGIDYWLSGWWQKYPDAETGEERTGVSLSIGEEVRSKSEARRGAVQREIPMRGRDPEPEPEPAPRRSAPKTGGKFDDMEDDIPF